MSTLVIGIGNPDRGDDAVGCRVIERLRTVLTNVRLTTVRGEMLALFDCWTAAGTVYVVDAMRSGAEPGTVRRLDASSGSIGEAMGSFVSTHALNLAEAVELARNLGRLPDQLILFGVEAADFSHGHSLSPAVADALDVVVQQIVEECRG